MLTLPPRDNVENNPWESTGFHCVCPQASASALVPAPAPVLLHILREKRRGRPDTKTRRRRRRRRLLTLAVRRLCHCHQRRTALAIGLHLPCRLGFGDLGSGIAGVLGFPQSTIPPTPSASLERNCRLFVLENDEARSRHEAAQGRSHQAAGGAPPSLLPPYHIVEQSTKAITPLLQPLHGRRRRGLSDRRDQKRHAED
jgi:hypothetical protein